MAAILPYIASNRDFRAKVGDDYPNIMSDGSLTYFNAGFPYDRIVPFQWWLERVVKDMDELDEWRVMIFIHGYYNSWPAVTQDSIKGICLANMISHFKTRANPPYPGPIILFDWPSYFDIGGDYCKSYNQAKGNARTTANTSFRYLRKIVDGILSLAPGRHIDLVCHSMGNYVLQQATLIPDVLTSFSLRTCFFNAPAISTDSFVPNSGSKTDATKIIQYLPKSPPFQTGVQPMYVFWSSNDDALPYGHPCDGWKELGRDGPDPDSVFYNTKISQDCSSTVDQDNADTWGAPSIHVAYYFIPDVLNQMVKIMVSHI